MSGRTRPAALPNMLVANLIYVPEKDTLYTGTHGQLRIGSAGAAATAAPAATTIDDRFDVGGYRLYLSCSGTGSATIVHLHGLGAASDGGVLLDAEFDGPERF